MWDDWNRSKFTQQYIDTSELTKWPLYKYTKTLTDKLWAPLSLLSLTVDFQRISSYY